MITITYGGKEVYITDCEGDEHRFAVEGEKNAVYRKLLGFPERLTVRGSNIGMAMALNLLGIPELKYADIQKIMKHVGAMR